MPVKDPVAVLRFLYGLLSGIFGLLLWAVVATRQAFGWIALLTVWLVVTLAAWLDTHIHIREERKNDHGR